MIYVALLRGINVGGNNKIQMSLLKKTFEAAGMQSVKTYINSGNIIFINKSHSPKQIATTLEKAIHKDFKLKIKVLIRSFDQIKKTVKALPTNWKNDATMKSNVMFLWEDIDKKPILKDLTIKPDLDTVKYIPGAVLWSVSKKDLTKSGLMKLAASKIYQHMTVRNVNTTRKIYQLMQDL